MWTVIVMNGRLFTLCKADNYTEIVAWGIEITDDHQTEAVTYRRDPQTGRHLFGQHNSVESARQRFSLMVPVDVVWEDGNGEIIEPPPPDGRDAAAAPAHPRS